MTSRTTKPIDPVNETLARLAELGESSVDAQFVSEAWRDALSPELEDRVGSRLTAGLTDAELQEFSGLVDAGDDNAATAWFEQNLPQFRDVVREEFNRLLEESVVWFLGFSHEQNAGGDQ